MIQPVAIELIFAFGELALNQIGLGELAQLTQILHISVSIVVEIVKSRKQEAKHMK